MILLLDEGAQALRVVASQGYERDGVGAVVPLGTGVIGVVGKKKKMLRLGNLMAGLAYTSVVKAKLEEAGQAEGLSRTVELPGLPKAQSQIAFPLLVMDRLTGVFAVESREPAAFDELDEVLLTILSHQAASAIENARLYQAEEERLKQLDEAHAKLSRLNESLEEKVRERTASLEKANAEISAGFEAVRLEKQRSQELLARMAPPEVVPLMLENKLLARKLKASILFTDLEGFTRYSSGMEPDELFSRLNDFFSRAGDCISKYRGYVNKTNGDSIMALFGVPYENPTHALDAVLAALAMQKDLYRHFALAMRVGINTGPITAGILGPKSKSLYDVLGDAVNLASRMEKVCPAGSVTVSEDTYRAVAPWFEVQPLGRQRIKGKGSLPCWQVTGLKRLLDDRRRVDPTSLFAARFASLPEEVEAFKTQRLTGVDFLSIQARDGALQHNEATAVFGLGLLKHLRQEGIQETGLRQELEGISEEQVAGLGLLHDLGKHALEPSRLNDANLGLGALATLRQDLEVQTSQAMEKLGFGALRPALGSLYRFEEHKGRAEGDLLTWLVAAGDMYDALCAPKIYKGRGWSIPGTLEELLRSCPPASPQLAVFRAFVELLRPEESLISEAKEGKKLFQ
jgi:adenylate cyclase